MPTAPGATRPLQAPETQNCRTNAGNADFALSTYYCNNPDTIAEYCGGTPEPKRWDPGKNNQCDMTTGPTQAGNPINAPIGIKMQTETFTSMKYVQAPFFPSRDSDTDHPVFVQSTSHARRLLQA
ncbi:hypothetical protein ACCP96_13280 [Xanthomonas campestris pv. fici]|uniref:hypothetical protein n=1 Tax=Xanthomonas euvesicatoria TaxID=456327 RepID=UPI0035569328